MNTLKKLLLLSFISMAIAGAGNAQNNKLYSVHEDIVKPSMVGEYEKIVKELKDNLVKYNIPGVQYIVTKTDDFRYLYVLPLNNMADLDKNLFLPLSEKMGKDKMGELFNRMDKCYDRHGTYTLVLDENLSYMPNGISQTQEGMPYRVFYWYHATPENLDKLAAAGKAVKDYHAGKQSKLHYRVYKSGFGPLDSYYMIAVSAKDPQHLAQMQVENNKLLGEAGAKLINDALLYTSKFETVNAWMMDELAYKPK